MADEDSIYMEGLRLFSHRTLVATIDFDVLVPYPTSAIRNWSPWITDCYSDTFSWDLRCYSGFTSDYDDIFKPHLFDDGADIDIGVFHNNNFVETKNNHHRYILPNGLDSDVYNKSEFPYEIMASLQKIGWRSVDLSLNVPAFIYRVKI